MSVFGSGYAWLVSDRGVLKIVTTPNQNSPVQNKLCPILAIDVWEHAYYLKHYNVRADYIKDWFNVINWNQAERNYRNCI
ncbi:Superoxide dismutase [Mn/Fe] [bioreactor metagenome]|uniref:Superoxide dismutase [Mn/Fe] n=1 Tax=bioreactor metagenome TaxID=1076179 RepID=A0A645FUF7_9ZZZZ